MLAQCAHRRFHRRAGGEPVVDDDHGLARERWLRAIAVVRAVTPLELDTLALGDRLNRRRRDAERCDDIPAEDAHAPSRDRANREFRMTGGAQLPYQENVQRRAEPSSDCERDWHAAAGKRENQDLVLMAIPLEGFREALAGFVSIAK